MKKILLAVCLIYSMCSFAQTNYQAYNEILVKYVNTLGGVDYKSLAKEKKTVQNILSDLIGQTDVKKIDRKEQLAYWINIYNGYTLLLIANHYPIKSIMELENGKVWDKKWITISGKTLSLNDIENTIIRPQYKDPRVHFVLNCSAKSCPPLVPQAFTGANVESMLQKLTDKFIKKDSEFKNNKLCVSKLFEWYASDFGDLYQYFKSYFPQLTEKTRIEYNEYDWSLNAQ